jgi:trigger factor
VESETCKKELVIEIPPDVVRKEAESVTAQYRRQVRIPGFRPGHAPAALVRKRYQDDIRNEVVQSLVPKYFEDAVKDRKMAVVGRPRFLDLKFGEDRPLTCTAAFEVLPEFDLKPYRGLEVTQQSAQVTEADITRVLEDLQQRAAAFEVVEDRPAADGDFLMVSYRGHETDNPAADPVEARDAMVHLGGEGTVAAFTENLRGSKPGDLREFEAKYPEDYGKKSLAGKSLEYQVEVHSIKTKRTPNLDEEFVKSVSSYSTLEELRSKIAQDLADAKKRQVEAEAKKDLLEQLIQAHDFPVPESLVEAQLDSRMERLLSRMYSQGLDPRSLDVDWRKIREDSRPEAEKDVRGSLILEKVAEAENIQVSEEEVDEPIRDLAQERHEAPAALKTRLTREGEIFRIKGRIRNQKALDLIYQNAKINQKSEPVRDQDKS